MGLSAQQAYALSRKYTTKTVEGAGAIKGAPCEIKSNTEIPGGHRIVFEWEDKEGNKYTDILDVMDGKKGDQGEQGIPGSDGVPGADGQDGYSPTITVKSASSDEYILTITDEHGSYDTPNLKGSGVGLVCTYSEENLSMK